MRSRLTKVPAPARDCLRMLVRTCERLLPQMQTDVLARSQPGMHPTPHTHTHTYTDTQGATTHWCVHRGMIVFKLERERPAYSTHQNLLYYVKDRYLRVYDFQTQRDSPLISIRRASGAGTNTVGAKGCAAGAGSQRSAEAIGCCAQESCQLSLLRRWPVVKRIFKLSLVGVPRCFAGGGAAMEGIERLCVRALACHAV